MEEGCFLFPHSPNFTQKLARMKRLFQETGPGPAPGQVHTTICTHKPWLTHSSWPEMLITNTKCPACPLYMVRCLCYQHQPAPSRTLQRLEAGVQQVLLHAYLLASPCSSLWGWGRWDRLLWWPAFRAEQMRFIRICKGAESKATLSFCLSIWALLIW